MANVKKSMAYQRKEHNVDKKPSCC